MWHVFLTILMSGGPHGFVVNVPDYDMVVNEFELQLRYNIHFRTNTLRKGMNSLVLPTIS